jgi:hypothetical protein
MSENAQFREEGESATGLAAMNSATKSPSPAKAQVSTTARSAALEPKTRSTSVAVHFGAPETGSRPSNS